MAEGGFCEGFWWSCEKQQQYYIWTEYLHRLPTLKRLQDVDQRPSRCLDPKNHKFIHPHQRQRRFWDLLQKTIIKAAHLQEVSIRWIWEIIYLKVEGIMWWLLHKEIGADDEGLPAEYGD